MTESRTFFKIAGAVSDSEAYSVDITNDDEDEDHKNDNLEE